MWFLLFSLGAVSLHRLRLPPAAARYVVVAPPLEVRYALFFLAAALLRLLVRDSRLAALERRTRRDARRASRPGVPPPGLLDVGYGVGKGVAEIVLGGDLAGAALGGAALLLRVVAARRPDTAAVARRAAERRRLAGREQWRAALCIVGVGLVCVAAAWAPLAAPRIAPAAAATWAAVHARLPWR